MLEKGCVHIILARLRENQVWHHTVIILIFFKVNSISNLIMHVPWNIWYLHHYFRVMNTYLFTIHLTDRITPFLWQNSLHVLMIRRSVNAIKPLFILYCIYKFCHNNSDQMFANFRRNEEEVVCCHSICGECEDGHFGRADGRGGSLLQEIYLGTAAQVQRG